MHSDARLSKKPKIKIHKNGKATLSGLSYRDLETLITQASLYLLTRQEKDDDDNAWRKRTKFLVLNTLKEAMSKAKQDTFPKYTLTTKQRLLKAVDDIEEEKRIEKILEETLGPDVLGNNKLWFLSYGEK